MTKIFRYLWPALPPPVEPKLAHDPASLIYHISMETRVKGIRCNLFSAIPLSLVIVHAFFIDLPNYIVTVSIFSYIIAMVVYLTYRLLANALDKAAELTGRLTLARLDEELAFRKAAIKERTLTAEERKLVEAARANERTPRLSLVDRRNLLAIIDRLAIEEEEDSGDDDMDLQAGGLGMTLEESKAAYPEQYAKVVKVLDTRCDVAKRFGDCGINGTACSACLGYYATINPNSAAKNP